MKVLLRLTYVNLHILNGEQVLPGLKGESKEFFNGLRVSSSVWRLREHNMFEEWQKAFILARIEFSFKLVTTGMVGKGQIQEGVVEGLR